MSSPVKGGGSANGAPDLLYFLSPSPEPLNILTVDCSAYLPRLRQLFPAACLFAVTEHPDVPHISAYKGLVQKWAVLPLGRDSLPFDYYFFDLVLAEGCLERSPDPYWAAQQLSQHTKGTGCLLTQFPNIRYWKILEGLRQGVFPVRERHFFAKAEVVRLLYDTSFKETTFTPVGQDALDTPGLRRWQEWGFDDFSHDLATPVWMVRADRSTAEVAALKSLYSPEVRFALAKLLRRIEYDIDAPGSLAALWALVAKETIFPMYLRDFVNETSIHKGRLLTRLAASAKENGLADFAAGLSGI